MDFSVIAEQVGVLAIVMLIGFVVVKTGYIKAEFKDGISKLIVNLILPCLIISSITSKEVEADFLGDVLTVMMLSVLCIGSLFLLGVITAKLFKIPDGTKTVHKLLFSLGNVIFIGHPIIVSAYGEGCFFYVMIYWLLNDLFLWTIGVFMFSAKEQKKSSPLKKLLNPNTISFFIAIVMLCFGIKLPHIANMALTNVGNLTTYLSMIFIGMALGTVNIKNIFKKWWIFIILIVKMIIMPIVFIYVFKALGIKELIAGVVVLEAAMPAQTVLSIIANEHKSDFEYATVGMFITTIASLLTLPFVCYLLNTLL